LEAGRCVDHTSREDAGDYVNPALLFNRTPLQVFLLDLATLGLYSLYWLIRNRRLAEYRLSINPMPYWHYLILLVPFWGMVVYVQTASIIGRRVEATGIRYPISFAWQAGLLGLVSTLWRLPDPWWLFAYASAIFLATMQVSLNRAEARDNRSRGKLRLTRWEIAILILGLPFFVIVCAGAFYDSLNPTSTVS
jgi:hypothetical protein